LCIRAARNKDKSRTGCKMVGDIKSISSVLHFLSTEAPTLNCFIIVYYQKFGDLSSLPNTGQLLRGPLQRSAVYSRGFKGNLKNLKGLTCPVLLSGPPRASKLCECRVKGPRTRRRSPQRSPTERSPGRRRENARSCFAPSGCRTAAV